MSPGFAAILDENDCSGREASMLRKESVIGVMDIAEDMLCLYLA